MTADAIVQRLVQTLGRDAVLDDPADRYLYARDASRRTGACLCGVQVENEEQVVALLGLAHELGFAVVPRGAGTSPTGSALPTGGQVVLDLSRMNRILEVNVRDQVAVVEPGVLTGDLQRRVEAEGLFYPPDPASSRFATLGGNVATGAGGLRAVKYGVTRDYVLGLRGVLADGRILETGGRCLKDVFGYDLTRLLVGSEGTLLVFTRIILKLVPRPETVATLVGSFPAADAAFAAADRVLADGVLPRALEFLDRDVLEILSEHVGEPLPDDCRSRLLVEVDGAQAQVAADVAATRRSLEATGANDVQVATGDDERERIWAARRSISSAVFRVTPAKRSEDIGVPRGSLARAIAGVKEAGSRHGIRVLAYGHAGDANLHCNFLYDPETPGEQERLAAAVAEAYQEVLGLGGTLSGEHGVGLAKAEWLARLAPRPALEILRGIKDLFDPEGILNPGKVLPAAENGAVEGTDR